MANMKKNLEDLEKSLRDLNYVSECLPEQKQFEIEEITTLIQHIQDLQQYLDASMHDLCRCILDDSEHTFEQLYSSAVDNLDAAYEEMIEMRCFMIDRDVVYDIHSQYQKQKFWDIMQTKPRVKRIK